MNKQAKLFMAHCPTPGYAIDVGANDGVFLSNTLDLEKAGWRVLCIEPNPYYGTDLWVNRKEVAVGACANANVPALFYATITANNKYAGCSSLEPRQGAIAFEVQVRTLDWYLSVWNPPQLDILTVDVEGGESNVLAGFDLERWKPKVICLEDWSMNNVHGGNLPGYTLHTQMDYDHIYLRTE